MGLHLNASNDLDHLSTGLLQALAEALRSDDITTVLQPQVIVVPTAGVRDWLRQRIADRLGICGGIIFLFPGQLTEWLTTTLGLPASDWNTNRARWTCLRLIADEPDLAHYLGDDPATPRGYSLAQEIINCFERYALYRPQATLTPWSQHQAGPHDHHAPWQPRVWQALRASGLNNPAETTSAIIAQLGAEPAAGASPACLHAFGFNAMAPMLLQMLAAYGQHHDVAIHSLQPTWGYWGDDQRPQRDLIREEIPVSEWGNRLLGDWGRVGRHFLMALDAVDADYQADLEDFRDPGTDCLLHRIQHDLVAAQDPDSEPAHTIASDDVSLQVHACASLRRQLEVAKAAIHEALAADPTLPIHDIAVMSPDPHGVGSLAQAIFTGDGAGPPLAVALADRSERALNPAADILLRLLDLLPSRFTASTVLDFLGCGPVAQAWGLDSHTLDRFRTWIDRADLRWGIDADHRLAEVGHHYAAGSWRHGLQRLQLAWWHGTDTSNAHIYNNSDDPAEGVVPAPDFEPDEYQDLHQLVTIIDPILTLANNARQPQPVEWWHKQLSTLLRHILNASEDDPDLVTVIAEMATWRQEITESGWHHDLTPELIAADFLQRFQVTHGGDFGRGAITICGMQPMRSVPFRMLCLVGMDDGSFPRESRHQDFDLLRHAPQPGDRDLRQDDRYLFLELLLSAGDRLCITYQGCDPRDRSPLPPATLVGELLEVVAATCARPIHDLDIIGIHRQHALHASLAAGSTWPSQVIASEHQALTGERTAPHFSSVSLPAPTDTSITLDELIAFWRNPAAAYLRRLGLTLEREQTPPREHERFTAPAGLDRYQAAQSILTDTSDSHTLALRCAAEGWLPPGAWSDNAWHSLEPIATELRAERKRLQAESQPATLNVTCGNYHITAALPTIHPELGVVSIHPGSASIERHLDHFIRGVFAALADQASAATMVYFHKNKVEMTTLSLTDVERVATDLLIGYQCGQQELLPYAARSSHTYVDKRWFAKRRLDHEDALAAAHQIWSQRTGFGNPRPAEMELRAHTFAWPAPTTPTAHRDFASWAERIWKPALAAEHTG